MRTPRLLCVPLVLSGCAPLACDEGFDEGADGNCYPATDEGEGGLLVSDGESGSSPYTGGWPIDRCDPEPEPTGNETGDVTANFSLLDQHGEMVELYDFCGYTIFLVAGAYW